MTETASAARALAEWALANTEDAARLWRVLQRHPGGMGSVYLPVFPSIDPQTVSQVRRIAGLEDAVSIVGPNDELLNRPAHLPNGRTWRRSARR